MKFKTMILHRFGMEIVCGWIAVEMDDFSLGIAINARVVFLNDLDEVFVLQLEN